VGTKYNKENIKDKLEQKNMYVRHNGKDNFKFQRGLFGWDGEAGRL
jgi:hypothetical protein